MAIERRNPIVSPAIECAFLFLACCVFGWGLQAKLSLYHNEPGEQASISYMAKLSTEKSSALTITFADHQAQRHLASGSQQTAAGVLSPLAHDLTPASLSEPEPGPRIPGRFNLHGPDLMRRPPPVLS